MWIKKNLIVMITCVIVMLLSSNYYAEEVWKITSLDWQPYSGADMTNFGNSIQKLKDLLGKEGITLKVEFYPWARSQSLAKTKDYIGYFPAWPEEVTEGFVASKPVDWSEIGIMKMSGTDIKFTTIDNLFKSYRIGVVEYVYPDEISKAMKKYSQNTDISQNETALLKKLEKKRFQVAITDPNVMLYLANKEGVDKIEVIKKLMKKELVVALRNEPDNKSKIDLLNKLLTEKK